MLMIPLSVSCIGTWEYFSILALSIFGIERKIALSYALVYHFISWVVVVTLGTIAMINSGFSARDIKCLKTEEM